MGFFVSVTTSMITIWTMCLGTDVVCHTDWKDSCNLQRDPEGQGCETGTFHAFEYRVSFLNSQPCFLAVTVYGSVLSVVSVIHTSYDMHILTSESGRYKTLELLKCIVFKQHTDSQTWTPLI